MKSPVERIPRESHAPGPDSDAFPSVAHPKGLTPLMTLDEVAAVLRLNPRTIRRLVTSGRLPCARLVGRLRFFEADVVRFVQARKG
jgi:excisionase family DNA binding protein